MFDNVPTNLSYMTTAKNIAVHLVTLN